MTRTAGYYVFFKGKSIQEVGFSYERFPNWKSNKKEKLAELESMYPFVKGYGLVEMYDREM